MTDDKVLFQFLPTPKSSVYEQNAGVTSGSAILAYMGLSVSI